MINENDSSAFLHEHSLGKNWKFGMQNALIFSNAMMIA